MHTYDREINNLIKENKKNYNKIIISSQKKFENIVDSIIKNNKKFNLIFINPHLNKNIYLSDIYIEFCKIEFLQSINLKLKQKKILINHLIKANKKINVMIKLKKIIKIFIYLISLIICKIYFKKNPLKREITIVDTYITDDMFVGNNFVNKFYINTNLNNKNKTIFFLPVILIKKGLFKKINIIKSNKLNYIFPFEVLSIYEILNIIFFPRKYLGIKYPSKIKKYEFFFKNRIKNDLYNGQIVISRIIYLVIKKLRKKHINITKSINWYENQSKDKCFNYSVRLFHKNSKIISYKSIFSDNDYSIHIIPSNKEYKKKYYPDVIFTNSYGDFIHKANNKLLMPLKIGPLGRFKKIQINNLKKTIRKNKNILVILPIDIATSQNIIKLIINFININKEYKFFFKIHPESPFYKKLLKTIDKNDHLFIINDRITKLLREYNTLITNGSSVSIEAYFKSKNVIISSYNEDRINNPLKYYNYNKCNIVSNEKDLEKILFKIDHSKIKKSYNNEVSLFYKKSIISSL